MTLKDRIIDEAINVGFSAARVTDVEYDARNHNRFLRWLERGYSAGMNYLQRATRQRFDPRLHLADANSAIVCAINYYSPPQNDPRRGYVSIYARGENYHRVVKRKLESLCERIRALDKNARLKMFVDFSPVSEKSLALKAGIGFLGRNGLIITPRNSQKRSPYAKGSFHFLGVIFTNLKLEPDHPVTGTCGRCRKCLDACPTGAIALDRVIDANKCISYHTTENKGDIPSEIAVQMGNMIYGCDICQLVCPYNSHLPESTEPSFRPQQDLVAPDLLSWAAFSESEYLDKFKTNSLTEIKFTFFHRNVETAVRNL